VPTWRSCAGSAGTRSALCASPASTSPRYGPLVGARYVVTVHRGDRTDARRGTLPYLVWNDIDTITGGEMMHLGYRPTTPGPTGSTGSPGRSAGGIGSTEYASIELSSCWLLKRHRPVRVRASRSAPPT
jgi:hypothetical protein